MAEEEWKTILKPLIVSPLLLSFPAPGFAGVEEEEEKEEDLGRVEKEGKVPEPGFFLKFSRS